MAGQGTRAGAIGRARAYLAEGRFELDLGRRVAIRTESQCLPDSLPHLGAYLADEMVPSFAALGFETHIYDNPVGGQGPVLLATRIEDPKLPTVLGYGHGDVVRGQESEWTRGKGPWVVARDGDRLYGRGTADNKAQHTINLAAMAAVMAERGGRLGFNAKVMIEMAEETGSKGLAALVRANREAFAADLLIASDGPRVAADRPTLTLGCRGALNFDLVCDLREGAHHSGNWGGLIADPVMLLAHALASIVGSSGELLVDALKAPMPSPAMRAALADVEVDGGASGPSLDRWWGEPGLTPAERVYAGNVFNVLAIGAGHPGRPLNAIQPKAVAHCQLRFIAGTDPATIRPALERHLRDLGHDHIQVLDPPGGNDGGFGASATSLDNPWVQWATASVQRSTNVKPAVIPQTGGSICNDVFTDILGLPTIWVPHSYPACSQHAPDEHILLPLTGSALEVMAGLYWDLGDKASQA